MTRTKWLALSIDRSISEMSDLLNKQTFLRGQSTGFELTDKQRGKIRGRFIEEIITNELVTDPFGEEILNNVRRYSIFDFQITPLKRHQFLICINTPPRSLKTFIAALSDIFGFGFAVEPLSIDILAMVQHLRKQSGIKRWTIKKVRMAHIQLNNSSVAKIEVVSDLDAYQDFQKCIDVAEGTLERATVALKDEGIASEIELVSTGVIAGDLEVLNSLMPSIQAYFITIDGEH